MRISISVPLIYGHLPVLGPRNVRENDTSRVKPILTGTKVGRLSQTARYPRETSSGGSLRNHSVFIVLSNCTAIATSRAREYEHK